MGWIISGALALVIALTMGFIELRPTQAKVAPQKYGDWHTPMSIAKTTIDTDGADNIPGNADDVLLHYYTTGEQTVNGAVFPWMHQNIWCIPCGDVSMSQQFHQSGIFLMAVVTTRARHQTAYMPTGALLGLDADQAKFAMRAEPLYQTFMIAGDNEIQRLLDLGCTGVPMDAAEFIDYRGVIRC